MYLSSSQSITQKELSKFTVKEVSEPHKSAEQNVQVEIQEVCERNSRSFSSQPNNADNENEFQPEQRIQKSLNEFNRIGEKASDQQEGSQAINSLLSKVEYYANQEESDKRIERLIFYMEYRFEKGKYTKPLKNKILEKFKRKGTLIRKYAIGVESDDDNGTRIEVVVLLDKRIFLQDWNELEVDGCVPEPIRLKTGQNMRYIGIQNLIHDRIATFTDYIDSPGWDTVGRNFNANDPPRQLKFQKKKNHESSKPIDAQSQTKETKAHLKQSEQDDSRILKKRIRKNARFDEYEEDQGDSEHSQTEPSNLKMKKKSLQNEEIEARRRKYQK